MEEATTQSQRERLRLVSELRNVLDDLERKLRAYRLDLVANFNNRYQQTLRDVEPVVACEIRQALASDVESDYPALAPDLKALLNHQGAGRAEPHVLDADTSLPQRELLDNTSSHPHPHPPAADLNLDLDLDLARHQPTLVNAGSPLSPDAAFGAAATGVALLSGDSHEREKEFQGLFTPFFLPLLDSSAPLNTHLQPITSPLPTIATSSPLGQTADAPNGIDSDFGSGKVNVGIPDHLQVQAMEGPSETGVIRQALSAAQAEAKTASPSPPPTRPGHGRTATDDTLSSTLSSALSDKSDGTTARRSALRRSSSISKHNQQSPRRVRFDFKGVEVLPTASPQQSDYLTPRPSSPATEDQPRSFDEIVAENSRNDEEEPASSAPPRKISSSDALRAMSRTPLDSGTVWTVVNPDTENRDEGSMNQASSLSTGGTARASPAPTHSVDEGTQDALPAADTVAAQEGFRVDPQSDDSSDEDFLSIGKAKSFNGKKPIEPVKTPTPTASSRRPVASTSTPEMSADTPTSAEDERYDKDQTSSEENEAEEDEDMFYFESGRGLSAPPRPRHRPPPLQEDEQEPVPERDDEPVRTAQLASPGIPIARSVGSGPATPTTSRFQVGSLGSYKGRPVVMPIVKNPELHAQAETLGEFDTFVGNVEEGELYSYRASLVQSTFTGEPRSLSERMMLEDARGGSGSSQ